MDSSYILVVEDNPGIAKLIGTYLTKENYVTKIVPSADEALALFRELHPELIIVDIKLQGEMDGFDFCRIIRQESGNIIPILIISSQVKTDDIITGLLSAGADDYMRKPLAMPELVARVQVLMRRQAERPNTPQQPPMPQIIQIDTIEFDPRAMIVRTPQKPQGVNLTLTETRLLRYMMGRYGVVLENRQLLQEVWGYPSMEDQFAPDVIRTHVHNLRHKLEFDPNKPVYLHTIYGKGYLLLDKSRHPDSMPPK